MTQRIHRRGARRGFTLTEAIIAMVLLSLIMVVFGASFPYASQTITRSRHMDLAANACQQELEVYRSVGYNSCPSISAGSTSTKVEFTPPDALTQATGTVTFTRVNDSLNATGSDTGRLKVEASIKWSGYGLDKGNVTLTTLIVR